MAAERFVMIATERFFLRPLRPGDVGERYLRWFNNEDVSKYIIFSKQAHDLEILRRYVSEKSARADCLFLGIFTREGEEHIGNIKYEPLNIAEGHAEMGILIGEPAWRGKGVAAEVLKFSAAWLKEHRGIRKITLGVHRENQAAIAAYEKTGFRKEASSAANEGDGDTISMTWHL